MDFQYPVIDMVKTGANIRRLRLLNHLTVATISKNLGFTTGIAIYKWQRGESLPTVDNLLALSRMFHVTMNEILITGPEEDESPLPFLCSEAFIGHPVCTNELLRLIVPKPGIFTNCGIEIP